MQTDEEMLAEIFRVYTPQEQAQHPGNRAYYDVKTGDIICFSQEILDNDYVLVDERVFSECRPDLYRVEHGELIYRDPVNQNKLRLRPNGVTFASIRNDQQFAVAMDWPGDKQMWDSNG
jgi:hypothetical protein